MKYITIIIAFALLGCQPNSDNKEGYLNQNENNKNQTKSINLEITQKDTLATSLSICDDFLTKKNQSRKRSEIDYSDLLPEVQLFQINTQRDTIIKTKSAMEIFIPARCLVFKNGISPPNVAQVSVLEYLTYYDMLAGNFSTSTIKGHLISGGMFDLTVSSQKQALELKPFSELIVQLPNEVDSDMMIYYGKRNKKDKVVWTIDKYSNQPYPTMVCSSGKFCNISRDFFENNFRFDKKSMVKLIDSTLEYNVSFGENASIIGSTVCNKNENKYMNAACNKFMSLVASLGDSVPNEFDGKWETKFFFTGMGYISYDSFVKKQKERQQRIADELKQQNISSTIVTSIQKDLKFKTFATKKRSFFVGRIGPLNIDKQLAPVNDPKTDLLVTGFPKSSNINMLFKNKKSFINSLKDQEENCHFSDLPKKKKLIVFSVHHENESIVFSSVEIISNQVKIIDVSDFKSERFSSLSELRKRINNI